MTHTSSAGTSSPTYLLARHVFLCRVGRHIVLLDLRRDLYLGFDDEDDAVLDLPIEGWPHHATASRNAGDPVKRAQLVQQLLDSGVITKDAQHGKSAAETEISRGELPLIDGYARIPCGIGVRDVVRFLYASVLAKTLLRRRPLHLIAERLSRRRIQRQAAPELTQDARRAEMQRCVSIFMRLRPLLFRAFDECLFNSLALAEFLALHGIYPEWIFGVTVNPFAAHCWLQQGCTVINDDPQHVLGFTPIMAI